jgi:(E)-4-hydroxy-3-methylbut-2-enyl-diphosphate synthase
VKLRLSHFEGLKIAVMGCVVNGPGEMSDADYGLVGAGEGKLWLYKGKTPILKHIEQSQAVEKLIEVITKEFNQNK